MNTTILRLPYAHKHTSALVKAPDGRKSSFMSRTWWKRLPGHWGFFALWQAVGLFLHTPPPLCAVSIILLWQGPDTSNRPHQMYMNYSDLAKSRCTAWCKVWKCKNLILDYQLIHLYKTYTHYFFGVLDGNTGCSHIKPLTNNTLILLTDLCSGLKLGGFIIDVYL